MDVLGEKLNVAYTENKDAMKMKLDSDWTKLCFYNLLSDNKNTKQLRRVSVIVFVSHVTILNV